MFAGVAAFCLSMPLPVPALKTGASSAHRVEEGDNPVVEVDFYRSMQADDIDNNLVENDNLADILGTIRYIHIEVLPEHIQDPARKKRKNDIDAVARWRFKVKNPMDLLESVTACQHQDFGPFMTFDGGQNTNEKQDSLYETYGDFVGIQEQGSQYIATSIPYFWYSNSGFCPNLPFECARGYPDCPDTSFSTERCDPEGCPGKGNVTSPDIQCAQYDGGVDVVAGGLCAGGDGSDASPTGERGCSYTYAAPDTPVMLDELVGITKENCGGHTCTDWDDFRNHCTNSAYKRKFALDGTIQNSAVCIEYDILPACQSPPKGCDNPACLAAEPKELGLPFWMGRCNATATMIRAEALAGAFSIAGATTEHQLLDEDLRAGSPSLESCTSQPNLGCTPSVDNGGSYCTRSWGSACQVCYIPGTIKPYANAEMAVLCPLDITLSRDYTDVQPNCEEQDSPIGLCCLYSRSCLLQRAGAVVAADDAELNFEGFLLVAVQKNTTAMATFLFRLCNDTADAEQVIADKARLLDVAYWQWQMDVKKKTWLGDPNETLAAIASNAAPCFAPANAPPSPGGLTTPSPDVEDPGSWAPVIVVICLLIVAGVIGVVWYRKKLQAQNRLLAVEQSLPDRSADTLAAAQQGQQAKAHGNAPARELAVSGGSDMASAPTTGSSAD